MIFYIYSNALNYWPCNLAFFGHVKLLSAMQLPLVKFVCHYVYIKENSSGETKSFVSSMLIYYIALVEIGEELHAPSLSKPDFLKSFHIDNCGCSQ